MVEHRDTDILIVGSGGAGLFAALHALKSAPGMGITVSAKGLVGKSGCTRMVQGGYNVALGRNDSVERHFMDTILGGKWLPNQEMAWRLCETAIVRVRELENEIGCFFDRAADGTLLQKAFAGQSIDRTVHKGDLTGIEIVNRLMEKVRASGIQLLEEHRAVALLPTKSGDRISGVLFIDIRTGEFRFVRARTVLLATGGGPTMYRYHTPSGDKSMDGLYMASMIGLPLRDMEMVQFHPTGLLAGDNTRMTGTVLEEGLRGAGGHLLNGDGRRFLFEYDDQGERATRDIVSRGIIQEIRNGRASPHGGVYISMKHLGESGVRDRFRGMVKRCADCGFDLAGGLVEVIPTAHYLMGGIVCDADTRTEMPGLYVAGEDAGGAHGANRLGGNGVANSTVFGGVAGSMMGEESKLAGMPEGPDPGSLESEVERACLPFRQGSGNIFELRSRLLDIMWDQVGIIRNTESLKSGLDQLHGLEQDLLSTGLGDQSAAFNLTWHDWLNLRSLIGVSKAIARAALSRENSRGAHFREDFPGEGSLEQSCFTVIRRGEGGVKVDHRPVDFSIVSPGQSLLEDGHGHEGSAPA